MQALSPWVSLSEGAAPYPACAANDLGEVDVQGVRLGPDPRGDMHRLAGRRVLRPPGGQRRHNHRVGYIEGVLGGVLGVH
jgi:hypothetical protein